MMQNPKETNCPEKYNRKRNEYDLHKKNNKKNGKNTIDIKNVQENRYDWHEMTFVMEIQTTAINIKNVIGKTKIDIKRG